MAIIKSELEHIIRESFPNATIEIIDLVGDEDHYSLSIIDKSFDGLPLIKQHKMVKEALKEVLSTKLHAITIKTGTPIAAIIPLSLTKLQDTQFQVMDLPLNDEYFKSVDDYRKRFTEMISSGGYTNMYRDAVDHLGNARGQHELKVLRLNLDML